MNSQNLISVIIGFRNRDLQRVRYALDALATQSSQGFELIFIDYGSDEVIANEVKLLVEQYPFAQYHYSHTRGWFWNRAHALNTGIKLAKGDVVLLFDIDLVIEKDFIKKITQFDYKDKFYTFSCFYLPEHFDLQKKILEKDGIHYEQNYVGLCAVDREKILTINGFDEYYQVWGAEDDDLYKRLSRSGSSRVQKTVNEFAVFHQWHPLHSPDKPSLWYLTMVNYLHNNFSVVRNNTGWGRSLTEADRPLLKKIQTNDFETELKLVNINPFLIFNDLLDGFYDEKKPSGFLVYEPVERVKQKKRLPGLLKKKSSDSPENSIDTKTVIDFLYYLIGINRPRLLDYFVDIQHSSVKFYYIKTAAINV